MPSIATLALVFGLGAAFAASAAPAPYTFIEGKVPEEMQPDGNSIVFEGPKEMLVIDTGRHPEHTDKIIAVAKARNKPITAIINTHWHLDHATGNARMVQMPMRIGIWTMRPAMRAFVPLTQGPSCTRVLPWRGH